MNVDPAAVLAGALPADPSDHGPIAVPSDAVRAVLERDRFPRRWIVGGVPADDIATAILRKLVVDPENGEQHYFDIDLGIVDCRPDFTPDERAFLAALATPDGGA